MMERACRRQECTVAQTGICLLNNDAATCPEREAIVGASVDIMASLETVLQAPKAKPKFPSSLTLSPSDLEKLTGRNYCRIVGILGAPDAGKTASLVSLYLLVSHARLDGFEFCDSRTLIAFEEISRGARRWNAGKPPEQMTSHTELADERTAGYLHLRLRSVDADEPFDLLLPDLPGEWTTSLIDNNRVDRLDFLKSADVIWLMIDGQNLIEQQTRMRAIHRVGLMMQRISKLLAPSVPPVTLVITRLDLGTPPNETIERLHAEASAQGIEMTIRHVASFADREGVAAGAGISDLIREAACSNGPPLRNFWADDQKRTGDRAVLRLRDFGETA
ncbi:MAG: hypothetical protein JF606_24380 [Burkholderiales bacterium]|nr:hypothetical protein [Burkholderiales bacterium]